MAKGFNVLEVIKKSFQLVFTEPSIIGIFFLPVLVALAVFYISVFLLGITPELITALDIQSLLFFSPLVLLAMALLMLMSVWIAMIGVGALILKVEAKTRKKKIKCVDTYKKGFKNSGRLFIAYLTEEGITSLGYLLFIIPGIYLAVKLALVLPGCILEKRGFGIRRSWSATRGNFWKILLFLVLWGVIFVLTSFVPYLMITWILIFPAYLTSLTLLYMKLRR